MSTPQNIQNFFDAVKEIVEKINDREPIRYASGEPVRCQWKLSTHYAKTTGHAHAQIWLSSETHWSNPVDVTFSSVSGEYQLGYVLRIYYGAGGERNEAGDEKYLVKGRALLEAVEIKAAIQKLPNIPTVWTD